MTSEHADTLNALSDMQGNITYALRRGVLSTAERIIVEQEKRIKELALALATATARIEERERDVFDAGFAACKGMGDNNIHYHGEQADRIFAAALARMKESNA